MGQGLRLNPTFLGAGNPPFLGSRAKAESHIPWDRNPGSLGQGLRLNPTFPGTGAKGCRAQHMVLEDKSSSLSSFPSSFSPSSSSGAEPPAPCPSIHLYIYINYIHIYTHTDTPSPAPGEPREFIPTKPSRAESSALLRAWQKTLEPRKNHGKGGYGRKREFKNPFLFSADGFVPVEASELLIRGGESSEFWSWR